MFPPLDRFRVGVQLWAHDGTELRPGYVQTAPVACVHRHPRAPCTALTSYVRLTRAHKLYADKRLNHA